MRYRIQKNENILVVCGNCGDLTPKDSNYCKNCGIKLSGSEKFFEDVPGARGNLKNQTGINNFDKTRQAGGVKNKRITPMQTAYLILGLIFAGFVLLYSSGIMDSGSYVSAAQNNSSPAPQIASIKELNKLEESVKNNPADTETLLKYAHSLNDAGFYQKAVDRYKEYLKVKPGETDVIVDMGVCYFQLGKYDEAVKNFKDGIKINPSHQIAHLNLGVVYNFGLKNKTEAIKWWKKAVELDPTSEIGKKAEEFLKQNK